MASLPKTESPNERRARIEVLVTRVVIALERLREYRVAADRMGDKGYLEARRRVEAALLELQRETAKAAVAASKRR